MVLVNKRLENRASWAVASRASSGEGRRVRASESYFGGGPFGFGGSNGGGNESDGDSGDDNDDSGGHGNSSKNNGTHTSSDPTSTTGTTNSTSTYVSTTTSISHGSKFNTGAIAGIASGSVAVVGFLLAVLLFLCFRKMWRQQQGRISSGKQLPDEQQEPQQQHQPSPPSLLSPHPQGTAEEDARNDSSALSFSTLENAVTLKMGASHGTDLRNDSPPSYADIEMGYLHPQSVDADGTVCNGFRRYRSDIL